MVPRSRRRGVRRLASLPAVLTAVAALSLVSACDKVPLLAPSGSVITLFPTSSSVPLNGSIDIVATVIENGTTAASPGTGTGTGGTGTGTSTSSNVGAGTPVQNGTLVTFTTTLGRIEPSEARTQNGQVRVRFISDGQSGTATITAFSGGASAKLENFPVGAAAAERLIVSATNQTLPANGGTTEVQARVENASGVPIAGVPVTFTTTAGSVSPSTAVTDAQGIARATLTATKEATVTARAGSKEGTVVVGVAERSGLEVTPSKPAASVGEPVTFTIKTTAGQVVTNARIDYGDGQSRTLGTISGTRTDTHVYNRTGNFNVTVTADNGENTGTSVSVGSASVTLTGPDTVRTNLPANFSVTVPANTQVREYRWDFGDGRTATTTSPQVSHTYSQHGVYPVRVEVIGLEGNVIGSASRGITVTTQ